MATKPFSASDGCLQTLKDCLAQLWSNEADTSDSALITSNDLHDIVFECLPAQDLEVRKQAAFLVIALNERDPVMFEDLFASATTFLNCVEVLFRGMHVGSHAMPSSAVLRSLFSCPSFMHYATSTTNGDGFDSTVVGRLAPILFSSDGCVATASWLTFAEFIYSQYHEQVCAFFVSYSSSTISLIVSCLADTSYVARRQMLKLLTMLLTERGFSHFRKQLVRSPALLCCVLELLNDGSNHIQYEAYHSLKVFIANPHKPLPIRAILLLNRDLLTTYLSTYSSGDPEADEQLRGEKEVLLRVLSALRPLDGDEEVLLGGFEEEESQP